MKKTNKIFFALMLLVGAVCWGGASAQAQSDIRKVDFKNFTYYPFCASEDGKTAIVTKGDGTFSRTSEDDPLFFSSEVKAYGDVDGDGKDEALVFSICNTGGTGQFTEGFLYSLKEGKPELLDRIAGGDRAYGGLFGGKIAGGKITIERYDVGEAGGACCPEFAVTETYEWNGDELREVGTATRKELYPITRLSFDKGKSSATQTIKLKAGDGLQRFMVEARAGQTLTVTTDTKDAAVEFLRGEAETTDLPNGFSADLKANSEYVFQVRTLSEAAAEVTFTVTIK